jgi:hypothetical protein
MIIRSDRFEQRKQWSVSTTRSMKATNRMAIDFEKAHRPRAPLRNRTVDLLLTISTARRPKRSACTDSPAAVLAVRRLHTTLTAPFHDSFHGPADSQLPLVTGGSMFPLRGGQHCVPGTAPVNGQVS